MTTHILFPAILALQSADQGLTANEVVESIPRDPASIFALVLIVGCSLAVIWFGRPRGGGTRPPTAV